MNVQTISKLAAAVGAAVPAVNDVAKCRGLSRNVANSGRNEKTKPPNRRVALAARQLTALRLLAAGCSVARAARTMGVNPRTIFRWLGQPAFKSQLAFEAVQPPRVSRNVAVCRDMSRFSSENDKTKPPPLYPSQAG